MQNYKTPILYLAFNRLDMVKKTFPQVAKIKPSHLFISCDGPRPEVKNDNQKVEDVRKYIKQKINWNCNTNFLFNKNNLGCKNAIIQAINWFFNNVEKGIIIEDDCLVDKDFFKFCDEMLTRYKNDDRIMHIGGSNNISNPKSKDSYLFSSFCGIWGWATWKRAWKLYDQNIKLWPKYIKQNPLACYTTKEKNGLTNIYNRVYNNKISSTWDFQWDITCKINNGLAVIPKVNLVSNIGFIESATHTKNINKIKSVINMKKFKLDFPLTENKIYLANLKYDKNYIKHLIDFWVN